MRFLFLPETFENEHGAVAIIVGVCLVMLIGFAGLSIDIGNLVVARNELQNAADAGALAGARFLYTFNEDGSIQIDENGDAINEGANEIAKQAAMANFSQNEKVEVYWTEADNSLLQTGDVQRGHYSFIGEDENEKKGIFYPNGSLKPTDLWVTDELSGDAELKDEVVLDADINFINAVRVVTRRKDSQVMAFFSRIFGFKGFKASAEAIAYLGFASKLEPKEADQPLAICKQSLEFYDGSFVGRMINSGGDLETSNTGGWTNFSHDTNTNVNDMKDLVNCDGNGGNENTVTFGKDVATHGGQAEPVFDALYKCWVEKTNKMEPWEITVLLIDCSKNNTGPWNLAESTLTVKIIWMIDQHVQIDSRAPTEMTNVPGYEDWYRSIEDYPDGQARWDDFVRHFNLRNPDGSDPVPYAPYAKKSIYFLPEIEFQDPQGPIGGKNYGIISPYPVLVK